MTEEKLISNGVMLNAYPDSIGSKLQDTITMLKLPAFKDAFSLFYILPTFFNSDLDRGFSIIDYDINADLVSQENLKELAQLNIMLKFDIILNHLSVASPQFKDLLAKGDESKYKDFFINWNEFWKGEGEMGEDGIIIPKSEHLDKLFMRKSGLPILKVLFPDGSERPYWNTFYQKISFTPISPIDLREIEGISELQAKSICSIVNKAIDEGGPLEALDLADYNPYKSEILKVINNNRSYLGQMDVNANSELIWEYYDEVLGKVSSYGCQILRLDAFAYLHKEVGQSNFFNKPGTWDHLERINQLAIKHNLKLLPEIHAEYGLHLHDEVSDKGYVIYDFFLPGLILHTIEKNNNEALTYWIKDIVSKGYKTVNMLGCHDGLPLLDLKGKEVNGAYNAGLLSEIEIEYIMDTVISRGGRVKNLFGADGKKISYYQVNATYYSALGENDAKMLLARAIQLFIPGIPQVWYLDLFVGKNDYAASDKGGTGSHKEINRTTLTSEDIMVGLTKDIVLNQLELIRFRNTANAFSGKVEITEGDIDQLQIKWNNGEDYATLKADLNTYSFTIESVESGNTKNLTYPN